MIRDADGFSRFSTGEAAGSPARFFFVKEQQNKDHRENYVLRTWILLTAGVLGLATGTFAAVDANYFPLQPGNRWVYRASSPVISQTLTITVGTPVQTDGQTYYTLNGYAGRRALVRRGDDGNLYIRDDNTQRDLLLTSFDPASAAYQTILSPECLHDAKTQERRVSWEKRTGSEALQALEIRYQSWCPDAGLQSELYLQNIGLVRRVAVSIGGPLVYELIYAHVGPITVEPETHTAFRIGLLNQAILRTTPTDQLLLRGTLRFSAFGEPLRLFFPSAQRYDLRLLDASGKVLRTWSADKIFAQVTTEILAVEEAYDFEMDFADGSGRPLPDGEYVLEAWLTVSGDRTITSKVPVSLLTRGQ